MAATTHPTLVTCTVCGTKNRVPGAASGTPHCGSCHAPLPWVADAVDGTFAQVAETASVPVLVYLWAAWCGPCRMVSPALEQLARDFAGKVKLVKVNVDDAPGIASRFAVQGVPTLLVTDRGEIAARQTGAAPAPVLRTWLEQALASAGAATQEGS